MTNESAKATLDRVKAPQRALAQAVDEGRISMTGVLQAVGIDPNNPAHQAALLVCDRYGLDPLLKHVHVFANNTYVTRDGYLEVAHRSGELDGIEVLEEDKTDTHWTAKVAVYRKDMSHAFRYSGRYPFKGRRKVAGEVENGPEMAVKVAEVAALRRAFPLRIPGVVTAGFEEVLSAGGFESDPEPAPTFDDQADAEWVNQAREADT